MPKEKLCINNISRRFGKTTALEDINLAVDDGEFCILLGPSGCGKSTLLRIIAGIDDPTKGEMIIDNVNVSGLPPRKRDVAMVFQSYALYPHMTVGENLAFPLKVTKIKREEIKARVDETADLLSIADLLARYPRELSGGQRQRVAIGRAIVRRPKLFLFDEPLSNLDARLRVKMRAELAALHKRLGATILYVTHDQTEAMTLGDRVVVMNEGRIQQIGSPTDVYEAPENVFVAKFIGSPEMNMIEGRVDNGGLFKSDGLHLRLSPFITPGRISVGMRPEDISLGGGKSFEEIGKARIDRLENLGSEMLIYIRLSGKALVLRSEPLAGVAEGEERTVFIKAEKVHIFRDGRRI